MIQVSELKGLKSLRAFNVFHTLMLGVKMLPDYLSEDYESFLGRVSEMSDADKVKVLTVAAKFVKLETEELDAIIYFCKDKNGLPYTQASLVNLTPDELIEIIVAVCMKISEIKIDILSDNEKKN